MGACLEYAARRGVPLMLYVFSDGSLVGGRHDRQQRRRARQVRVDRATTSRRPRSFFLVYNPGGRAQLYTGDSRPPEQHQQIGWFRKDGSVETAGTPAANNVNLLVETVVLNYMALHGEQGQFGDPFPGQRPGIGVAAGQPHRVQSDRQRHHCVTCAETAGAP